MQRAVAVGGMAVFTLIVVVACVDEPSAARRAADVSATLSTRCPRSETNRPECTRQARTAGRLQGIQSLSYQPSQFDAGTARNVAGGIVELTSDDAYRGRTAPLVAQTLAPFSNRSALGDGRFTDDSVTIQYEPFAEPIADAGVYTTLGWEYWDDYPHSPQGVPMSTTDNRVLWLSPDLTANPAPLAITIRSSRLLTILGIEVSGFATDLHDGYGYQDGGSFTLQYYRDSAPPVASASSAASAIGGAQSLAASGLVHTRTVSADQWNDVAFVGTEIPGGFNRVVVTGSSYLAALVNVRYRLSDSLSVACTPSGPITRGDRVTCRMSAGAATVSSRSWRFDNDSADRAVLDFYPTPDNPEWSGPLALPGKIWAFATVNGRRDSASTSVTIRARDWIAAGLRSTPVPVTLLGQGGLLVPPIASSDLGSAVSKPTFREYSCELPECALIAEGPNTGLGYMVTFPISIDFHKVAINVMALTPGSAWLSSFPQSQVNGRCASANVQNLLSLVENHEGTSIETQRDSHTRIWRDAIDTLGAQRMERAVFNAKPEPFDLFKSVDIDALIEAKIIDDTTRGTRGWLRNPVKLPCKLF